MICRLPTYGLIGLVFSGLLSSCSLADRGPCDATPITSKAPAAEIAQLKRFIDSSRVNAVADARGFYYTVQSPGTGAKPTVCSNVTVNYTGQLINGTSFDQGNGISFGLSQLIVGWQEGIPLVAPGGRITLYLPPSLAYGSQAQNGIPANSILIFQIDLLSIN